MSKRPSSRCEPAALAVERERGTTLSTRECASREARTVPSHGSLLSHLSLAWRFPVPFAGLLPAATKHSSPSGAVAGFFFSMSSLYTSKMKRQ